MRTKIIKGGTAFEELRILIASIVRKESDGLVMKFTICFDGTSTFVDLVDDEGVEHFISFNGESGHIYVGEDGNDNTQPTREDTREEEFV